MNLATTSAAASTTSIAANQRTFSVYVNAKDANAETVSKYADLTFFHVHVSKALFSTGNFEESYDTTEGYSRNRSVRTGEDYDSPHPK